jgi:hypothetical protein
MILDTRKSVEEYINWDCEIVRNYAEKNQGVYNRIGEGAKWVFTKEEKAIFLEDDNLPETTFFPFCEEMLERYKDDTRVLWVCGTNYLGSYEPEDSASYMFTKHMLPCGWASWSDKFIKFYDGNLDLLNVNNIEKRLSHEYSNRLLYDQDVLLFHKTKYTLENDIRNCSWDKQIAFSLRVHDLYGISPKFNQIENIGVDIHSIHGGTSFSIEMTRRFCGIKTHPISFPLEHPRIILPDENYEKAIDKVVLYPWKIRLINKVMTFVKPLLGIDKHMSFKRYLNNRKNKTV